MSKYFLTLMASFLPPFFLSFYPPLKFYKNIKALFVSIISTTIIFGGWDVFAKLRGHWYFEPTAIWGKYFLGLPYEEWLFFIVIPFCCLFTWETLKHFTKNSFNQDEIK